MPYRDNGSVWAYELQDNTAPEFHVGALNRPDFSPDAAPPVRLPRQRQTEYWATSTVYYALGQPLQDRDSAGQKPELTAAPTTGFQGGYLYDAAAPICVSTRGLTILKDQETVYWPAQVGTTDTYDADGNRVREISRVLPGGSIGT